MIKGVSILGGVLVGLFLSFAFAQAPERAELNQESIQAIADALRQTIVTEVAQSGGNLETQHVTLLFAFSTGHFAVDPNLAMAAREIAWLAARDLLVEGDRVTVLAWEMEVWDHLGGDSNTVTLLGSDEQSKVAIKNLWPFTPRSGSIGGHDTELAMVQAIEGLDQPESTIVVLITNDALSISTGEVALIGQDEPRYLEMLESWRRLSRTSSSGTTIDARFTVNLADGREVQRKLDLVVLVPRAFAAAPLGEANRNELLNPPEVAQEPELQPAPSTRGWWWLALLVPMLGSVSYITLKRRTGGAVTFIDANGQHFNLSEINDNKEVFTFVGPQSNITAPRLASSNPKTGSQELVKVFRSKDGLRFKGTNLKVVRINGKSVRDPHQLPLKHGEIYKVSLRGEVKPDPNLPPVAITDEITIRALSKLPQKPKQGAAK